jgi:1-acyl-sn-glycerol-3-phosphate acyltransferase
MDEALAQLGFFERLAFRVMRWASEARVGQIWQHFVLVPFVSMFVSRRLVVSGLERVPADAQARILLVANHRTFFDQFILGYILFKRGLRQRLHFPVRANFFYENPLGLLICLAMSGGSMFPPFFRKAKKKGVNKLSLQTLVEMLQRPAQMVGFHPEGTRNKTDDPYQLLPAQPGVGELALKARPIVIPAFITGLTNSVFAELFANLRGQRTIVAVFGAPIDLSAFPETARLTHHKQCADLFTAKIAALAEEEKALRSSLTRGAA